MMNFSWYVILFIFLFAAGISYWLTLRLLGYLVAKNIVDTPNHRSLHSSVTPRGGGLVFIGLLLIALVFFGLVNQRAFYLMIAIYVSAWAILSAADDVNNLSPRVRFLAQLIFASLAVFYWGGISELTLSNNISIQLSWLGYIVTILGIVWVANLYNFMDGMDGLAASQAIVAAITLAFWFNAVGDIGLSLTNLILAAACYGFIQCNWSPAKLFMGDIGSVTLGAYFALMTVIASVQYDIPVMSFIVLFAVFVFDATLTLLERAIKGEKIWQAHSQHTYQRAAKLGFRHSRIVVAMLILMVIQSLLGTFTVQNHDMIIAVVIASVFIPGFAVFLVRKLEKKETHD